MHSDVLSAGNAGPQYRTPVGLDLSLACTGIAWRRLSGEVCTQTVTSKLLTKCTSHRVQTERLSKLAETIAVVVSTIPGNLNVMIEAPAFGAIGHAADTAQLHGAVRTLLVRVGIWPEYVEALSVRRIVLGVGCKKKEAVKKVRDIFQLRFPTNDECDAYLIMRTAEIAATPTTQWLLPDVATLVQQLRVRNG